MSTSYDIYCCDCYKEVPDWRDPTKTVRACENTCFNDHRDGKSLVLLLSKREGLEAFARLLKEPELYRFTDWLGDLGQALNFFQAHEGHTLEVRNEYGDIVK